MRNKIAGKNDGINKKEPSTTEYKPKKNIFRRIKSVLKQKSNLYIRKFKANKKASITFLTGIFAFAICLCLLSNIQVGYAVVFNDKTIGFVSEKYSTELAINKIYSDIETYAPDEDISITTNIKPSVAPDMYFKSETEIADIIKANLDFYVDACCIVIDGETKLAVKNAEEADAAIQGYKDSCVGGEGEVINIEVKENIEYLNCKVVYTTVLNVEDAIKTLHGAMAKEGLYTVVEGDTLWSIGIENNMPTDYLMELNGLDSEFLNIGDVLRVTHPTPMLTVTVEKRINYTEYIPYETEQIYDKNLTKGTNKTTQKGQNGENYITAVVTLVNLQETNRVIENTEHICDPVKEIIRIGTKPKPKTAATGRFGRPINGGYVSSAFGNRSRGYHTGIDYALSYGSPIYASDGGTVTYSGWSGGYGYMIKINHGNGYETLYAHCSRLAVSTGKKVAKGQVIAYVGSTGNSTGPHLHFEIRKNGSYMNPANYY